MNSVSKINKIKTILHGQEMNEMNDLLHSLKESRDLHDSNLNRIIKDYQTRLNLLEKKTSEINAMLLEHCK